MPTSVKRVLRILYHNRQTYVLKSLVLQFVLVFLGNFGLSELFNLILVLGKQENLSTSNFWEFFLSPLTLMGLVVYFLCLALLIFFEFSLLIGILQGRSLAIKPLIKQSFPLLKGWNWLFLVGYLVLTIPVSVLTLTSSLVEKLYIPYFITDEWLKTPQTALPLLLGAVALVYLNFRLIYSLPLLALRQEGSFRQHLRESWRLTRGRLWVTIWHLLCLYFPLTLILLLLAFLIFGIIAGAEVIALSQSLLIGLVICVSGLTLAIEELVNLGLVAYLLDQINELPDRTPRPSRKRKIVSYLGLVLFFLLLGIGRALPKINRLTYNPYNQEVKTIAHRGAVAAGVENSLEALEAAAQQGADFVEMDIILTADHDFIVSHDNNLKRLTGAEVVVSQSKLADLEGLPISQGEFTSQLVSFDDYVVRAKELGIKLMVEVKPHGEEPENFAQLVIKKLQDLGVSDTYKVMSLDLTLMEEIERLAPGLNTGYIIPLQIGSLSGEKVDFILIEDFSYRDRLVWEAKFYNQDLYVWTINREEQMRSYLQRPIAGMITDKPDLVQSTKTYFEEHKDAFNRLLQLLD